MDTIIKFFSGKKTFIIAILMIILGIFQENTEMIMEGLAIGFLRMGIEKAIK